jgi:hypothetical protein
MAHLSAIILIRKGHSLLIEVSKSAVVFRKKIAANQFSIICSPNLYKKKRKNYFNQSPKCKSFRNSLKKLLKKVKKL